MWNQYVVYLKLIQCMLTTVNEIAFLKKIKAPYTLTVVMVLEGQFLLSCNLLGCLHCEQDCISGSVLCLELDQNPKKLLWLVKVVWSLQTQAGRGLRRRMVNTGC